MDTLRGNFGDLGSSIADEPYEEEAVHDAPPPEIGTDERRMQVRAYNFWAGLLEDRNLPNVEDLDPDSLPDFGPNGVLLDFSHGIEDPAVSFLGAKLSSECGADGIVINRLSDVPARSLLSRITDHYMQILANQAPIGFEAEFVNQRGATILYRGILLPFSSDDETIDFIFGVINWKEMANAEDADELLLEINQALETPSVPRSMQPINTSSDWADDDDDTDSPGWDMHEEEEAELPAPSFGLPKLQDYAPTLPEEPEYASLMPQELAHPIENIAPLARAEKAPLDLASFGEAEIDPADMGLYDWLASARELADEARSSEDRTRGALYEAIGRAHDFALAAFASPAEFTEMVEDAGLTMQDRAPMTPVVKLVFGSDYDKTRLTEYAAALTHAQRIGLEFGMLADFLRQADGGLKGVVQEERRLRRAESGKPAKIVAKGPRKSIARKLRAIEPSGFDAISAIGEEFALVMVRRTERGEVVVLGEVPEDAALVEKAARKLVG